MKKEIKYLATIFFTIISVSILIYQFSLKQKANSQFKITPPKFPLITNLVADHSYSYGPVDAKVTVVEYFDPECESCAAVASQIKKEMKFYEGKVRWVFRYMPYHFNSKNAIAALEAAKKQNLFLETMDLLFKTQNQWGEKRESTKDLIIKIVLSNKTFNQKKFLSDIEDPAIQDIILKDQSEGQQAGVKGTPSFFVNGVMLEQLDLDTLIAKINQGLAQ